MQKKIKWYNEPLGLFYFNRQGQSSWSTSTAPYYPEVNLTHHAFSSVYLSICVSKRQEFFKTKQTTIPLSHPENINYNS